MPQCTRLQCCAREGCSGLWSAKAWVEKNAYVRSSKSSTMAVDCCSIHAHHILCPLEYPSPTDRPHFRSPPASRRNGFEWITCRMTPPSSFDRLSSPSMAMGASHVPPMVMSFFSVTASEGARMRVRFSWIWFFCVATREVWKVGEVRYAYLFIICATSSLET